MSYEKIQETGCIMGSGTIRVFHSDSCAVEMTRDVMAYLQAQSCGKCVFCREGTYQMLDILSDISENRAKPEDIDQLFELAEAMKTGSICDLGKYASAPVESGIRLFRSDFDAHIKEKRCPQNNSG
jgi:NADH-quinone oxidoreductase subunit F